MTLPIDLSREALYSDEIIERVQDLSGRAALTFDEKQELSALLALCEQGMDYPDWHDGALLIRDYHFREYARELAIDVCEALQGGAAQRWPLNCIDWQRVADELAQDYGEMSCAGRTFLART